MVVGVFSATLCVAAVVMRGAVLAMTGAVTVMVTVSLLVAPSLSVTVRVKTSSAAVAGGEGRGVGGGAAQGNERAGRTAIG